MTPTTYTKLAGTFSHVMYAVCIIFTVVILSMLVLVTGYLLWIGIGSLSIDFFTRTPTWDPSDPGGVLNAIIGTSVLIGVASAVGIPIGMLAGVYLAEYDVRSYLAAPVRFVCDVLAGVPSIVVGILGYELVVRPMGNFNGWAGALALAFIMIPIVARTTEEMMRLVPESYREAAIALGSTKARAILNVVIPSATGSIITGIMLAVARVAGETAPLLFTALASRYIPVFIGGDAPYIHPEVLKEPFPSLTVQIYNYANHPSPEIRKQAWAGILVLITLIFILNVAIRFVTRRSRPKL